MYYSVLWKPSITCLLSHSSSPLPEAVLSNCRQSTTNSLNIIRREALWKSDRARERTENVLGHSSSTARVNTRLPSNPNTLKNRTPTRADGSNRLPMPISLHNKVIRSSIQTRPIRASSRADKDGVVEDIARRDEGGISNYARLQRAYPRRNDCERDFLRRQQGHDGLGVGGGGQGVVGDDGYGEACVALVWFLAGREGVEAWVGCGGVCEVCAGAGADRWHCGTDAVGDAAGETVVDVVEGVVDVGLDDRRVPDVAELEAVGIYCVLLRVDV